MVVRGVMATNTTLPTLFLYSLIAFSITWLEETNSRITLPFFIYQLNIFVYTRLHKQNINPCFYTGSALTVSSGFSLFSRQILKGWWHPFSPQYRKMQVQYDKYFDERGQITVFLSLLFLVLMMSFLFIVEGVISYSASSLGEDAVKGAGESIMANYDRELFKNYHLFFLDPRQKDYIVTDGKEFINQYFSGNSFFDIYCDSLEVTGEKTAVDEDGLYLKHEIREWMKYRE